ncbi:TetR/AcrR family transcriptional regulator [Lactobacillus delbrueckii]|uniref:TetR/AcrR family transcriptional regulator n=1 Tax=Lactobacillus delbrueckii TaxID=1584 RepID=UPI0022E2E2DE|nr:hypothetical protein [Lactobacillus delbrueckii]
MTDTGVKKALKRAFFAIASSKKVNKITIRELCQQAHVSRSSFYYTDLYELLDEIEDEIVATFYQLDSAIIETSRQKVSDFAYFEKILSFVKDHAAELRLLLIEQRDYNLIIKWEAAIKKRLRQRYGKNKSELALDIAAASTL